MNAPDVWATLSLVAMVVATVLILVSTFGKQPIEQRLVLTTLAFLFAVASRMLIAIPAVTS
jgi:hypothetical protein